MHNPVSKKKLTKVLAAAVILASTSAVADDSFEAEIEYRQGVMNVLSWNMKHIGGMLKGKTPYDAEKIKTHAADIASVASLDIMAGFPEDSTSEDSSALEDIWMDFEKFEQKMADFKKAAAGMNQAAQSGDQAAVGKAMGDLGESCKGCHKPFKN
jgi:cytochrome c556